ncbi:MAG: mRNA interferase MazF [Clostridia bacterium]|nr:mRNA interferase MazF [Clostridia bacterium]MDK2901346.1 mRNA interferase MazF [Thermosediminibacterales bacterium]
MGVSHTVGEIRRRKCRIGYVYSENGIEGQLFLRIGYNHWIPIRNEKFLKKEKDFDPQTLIKYKRGNVVNAHLGYNIGSEL